MWEWEEGLSSRPCEKGARFEVGVVLWIRDLPLGPPMVDATFPSDHGENSSCLVKSIEGGIVTASCTTGVIGGGAKGKRSAGLWGTSSRFWLGSADTSSLKLKRCDYPGMELNFTLMFHTPWLYQERVPTSNKEKKIDKKKWKKKDRKNKQMNQMLPTILLCYYST